MESFNAEWKFGICAITLVLLPRYYLSPDVRRLSLYSQSGGFLCRRDARAEIDTFAQATVERDCLFLPRLSLTVLRRQPRSRL